MLTRIKHIVRDQPVLRTVALRAGALVRSLAHAEPGIYTLCYHHVAAEAQANFSAQIGFLKRFGSFIDADTALALIAAGRALEERTFLLTFDDGYADNVDVALPVIRQHGVPAMLFLVSDWLREPPPTSDRRSGYMTPADVGTWLAAGLDIGSHSATHRLLSQLDGNAVEDELARSGAALSALSGRPVLHFACPWGVADRDYRTVRDPALAAAAGYRTFFTTRRGQAHSAADLLAMPRHVVEPEWETYQLDALLGRSKLARA